MARISLRQYNREIEKLIDRGQVDEAIIHCKHILNSYPKHLDTYRLLGKAFLETQQFAEASDILQRTLSVIPDDFISHIGMSIIREEEHNLDAAIWHMERAFEIQPSNSTIQDEIRRLYGKRDNYPPPKVRVTRGGLARMYARGNLFYQAISEIRSILAEDPHRPDLQVLLARMYYLSSQKIEATEICGELIAKYPYCLEANFILSQILPGTSRAEDAKIYRQRVCALDPYYAHTTAENQNSGDVPDNAVGVERLDYRGGAAPSSWNQGLPQDTSASSSPQISAWVPAENEPLSPEQAAGVAAVSGQIPDWMAQAGWAAATGEAEETLPVYDEGSIVHPSDAQELAPAEIPDWLQSLAPPDQKKETDAAADIAFEDIFSNMDTENPPVEIAKPEKAKAIPTTGILRTSDSLLPPETGSAPPSEAPVWVSSSPRPEAVEPASSAVIPAPPAMLSKDVEGPAILRPAPTSSSLAEEEAVPEWLQEIPKDGAAIDELASEGIPEWLQQEAPEFSEAAPATIEAQLPVPEPPAEKEVVLAGPEMVDEVPEWLESLGEEEIVAPPQAVEQAAPQVEAETPSIEQMPDWLQEQEESALGKPQSSAPQAAPSTDDLPDWLLMDEDEAAASEAASVEAEEGLLPAEMPDWIREMAPTEEEKPAVQPFKEDITHPVPSPLTNPVVAGEEHRDETEAWLAEIVDQHNAEAKTLIAAPEERLKPPSDWTPMQETPSEEIVFPTPEVIPSAALSDGDAALAWLESLAAQHGAEEEALITRPEERLSEAPAWVKEEASQPVVTAPLAEETLTAELAETPEIEPLEPTAAETLTAEAPQVEPAEASAVPDLSDGDAALAWLESLAAQHGAEEEALITRPEERLSEAPAWVKEQASQPVVTAPLAEETPTAELAETPEIEPLEPTAAETLTAEAPQVEPAEAPAVPDLSDGDAALAWLESLAAQHGAEEEALITRPEERLSEAPAWVKEESQSAESPAPPIEEMELMEESPVTTVETPAKMPAGSILENEDSAIAWLETLAAQQEQKAETMFVNPEDQVSTPPVWIEESREEPSIAEPVGEIPTASSSELPSWLNGYDEQEETMPALEDELNQLKAISEAEKTAAPVSPQTTPAVTYPARSSRILEEAPPITPMPEIEQFKSLSFDAVLEVSQKAFIEGNIPSAVDGYNHLIQKGQYLEEAIHDLRDALYRFPVDITIWQALGDAYIRTNRLQDALDAYTKAEELLR